ncbi:MAG: hypothetical protein QOD06_1112 [Candidatus Binatota bacterium]|nr:hypothetical protein [Candidatus Binatota bacterium]
MRRLTCSPAAGSERDLREGPHRGTRAAVIVGALAIALGRSASSDAAP